MTHKLMVAAGREVEATYVKRLGYVLIDEEGGIEIDGVRWGTLGGIVAVYPDQVATGLRFRTLPDSVRQAAANYDGLIEL